MTPRTLNVDNPNDPELPSWVTDIRPEQQDAVCEIVEEYERGAEVVFVDGPTGSGKTLIAELVRRELDSKALYVCSGKGLQDQFARDFGYARVLKGRSNYLPQVTQEDVTCADCDKDDAGCSWCAEPDECSYQVAKKLALRARLAVVNTSYLLAEANHIGNFSNQRLVIADECDMVERELMGFVEYRVSRRNIEQLGLKLPVKAARRATLAKWLLRELQPAAAARIYKLRDASSVQARRQRQTLVGIHARAEWIAEELLTDAARTADEEVARWVRDYSWEGSFVMRPVLVDGYGDGYLWRHGKRWLCMSATIISAEEQVQSLGLERPWSLVRVPMTFPVENRPIVVAGVANVTAKDMADALPKLRNAIVNISLLHPTDRILVHTVSYKLARDLALEMAGHTTRRLMMYSNAQEREEIVARYRQTPGAILLAPSLDRGFDFAGDDCRVVVVAKMPYPYLGDKQVSTRTHLPGGDWWYRVQTVRTLVQMTGRGVRNKEDSCTTYILDRQFESNVWKRSKQLLPEWWREAVDRSFPVRNLTRVA